MAEVRALKGLRYSDSAGDPANLIAPPYDVLTQAQRDDFAAKSPYNIVHLTLPEKKEDDRSKFVQYARSNAALQDFRRNGALVADQTPAIYRLTQTFEVYGKTFSRTTFLALLRVEPFSTGTVLPHEFTFPKHKEDRLRILETTRTHLESIFGLYEDQGGELHSLVTGAPAEIAFDVAADGIQNRFEVITDESIIAEITAAMADRKVWIADGHHRYETALAYREAQASRLPMEGERVAEDYILMAFGSMSDPGLVLLPTHRILKKCAMTSEQIEAVLREKMSLTEVSREEAAEKMESAGAGTFLFVLPDKILLGSVDDGVRESVPGEDSLDLKSLDVAILHRVVLEQWLETKSLDNVGFTRDEAEAFDAVRDGAALSVLMNPPSVDDMKRVALNGERMPQKSTFYYPKILSGLVLWSHQDF